MQAKDVMTRTVVTVTADISVTELARQLIDYRISAVPVVDSAGKIVGIVSEGDLMRRAEAGTGPTRSWWLSLIGTPADRASEYIRQHGKTAGDVMTRKVISVSEDTDLSKIASLLEKHRIKRVPVVRDGKPVGIVSRANLLHGLASALPAAKASARDDQIRTALDEAFRETGVSRVFVNAVVADGVVQIWGEVDAEEEAKALGIAAEGVPGVKQVINNVTVMTPNMRAMTWE